MKRRTAGQAPPSSPADAAAIRVAGVPRKSARENPRGCIAARHAVVAGGVYIRRGNACGRGAARSKGVVFNARAMGEVVRRRLALGHTRAATNRREVTASTAGPRWELENC